MFKFNFEHFLSPSLVKEIVSFNVFSVYKIVLLFCLNISFFDLNKCKNQNNFQSFKLILFNKIDCFLFIKISFLSPNITLQLFNNIQKSSSEKIFKFLENPFYIYSKDIYSDL